MRTRLATLIIGLLVSLALLGLPVLPAWAGPRPAASAGSPPPRSSRAPAPGRPGSSPPAASSACRRRPTGRRPRAEIAELEALAAQRDAAALDRISYWDAGAPGYRWNDLAVRRLGRRVTTAAPRAGWRCSTSPSTTPPSPPGTPSTPTAGRARPPSQPGFATALPTPASPAYPSEHAVAAGAASTVLSLPLPGRRRPVRRLGRGGRPLAPAGRDRLPQRRGRRAGAGPPGRRGRRRAGQGGRLRRAVGRQRADRAGQVDRDQPGRAAGRHLEDLGADLAPASSGPARARPTTRSRCAGSWTRSRTTRAPT